ncbi:hypothetical protein, partial [Shigella sonnei]|uniref:hypothetical protein n=1 Tax=Shigella sonnei TaxID=624 RepID=UPI001C0A6910
YFFLCVFFVAFCIRGCSAREIGVMCGIASVLLVICFDLAIDQIAQSGLSSLKVIYYSAQLFSIKTITYLSDTGCLEIQGASLL